MPALFTDDGPECRTSGVFGCNCQESGHSPPTSFPPPHWTTAIASCQHMLRCICWILPSGIVHGQCGNWVTDRRESGSALVPSAMLPITVNQELIQNQEKWFWKEDERKMEELRKSIEERLKWCHDGEMMRKWVIKYVLNSVPLNSFCTGSVDFPAVVCACVTTTRDISSFDACCLLATVQIWLFRTILYD